jgi:hypothetical protein
MKVTFIKKYLITIFDIYKHFLQKSQLITINLLLKS